MSRNYRQKTSLRVVIHTQDGDFAVRYTDQIKSDVFSATIDKSLTQLAGGFSLSLVWRPEYSKSIKPNDWVSIYIDDGFSPPDPHPYMIGLIDRVTERSNTGREGAPDEFLEVMGRDYGKVLAGIQLVHDPHLANADDTRQMLTFLGSYAVGGREENRLPLARPGEIVKIFLDLFHTNRNQFLSPSSAFGLQNFAQAASALPGASLTRGGASSFDSFGLDTSRVEDGFGVIGWLSESNLQGNLWSLLRTYSEETFFELFVDTLGGRPALIFRTKPFSPQAFANLPAVELRGEEVFASNIGRGEADIRNWFRVFLDMGSGQDLVSSVAQLGYLDPRSIFAHGLRRMEPTTRLLDRDLVVGDETRLEQAGFLQRLSGLLAEWYYQSDRFWSGTFTLRVRPDLRVGTRLDYTSKRRDIHRSFYVEAVNHKFEYPGQSTSTVTVSRGIDRSERLGVAVYDRKPLADLVRSNVLSPIRGFKIPTEIAMMLNTGPTRLV